VVGQVAVKVAASVVVVKAVVGLAAVEAAGSVQ
jgi:hypothetical protein